jgi:hypothetical protein
MFLYFENLNILRLGAGDLTRAPCTPVIIFTFNDRPFSFKRCKPSHSQDFPSILYNTNRNHRHLPQYQFILYLKITKLQCIKRNHNPKSKYEIECRATRTVPDKYEGKLRCLGGVSIFWWLVIPAVSPYIEDIEYGIYFTSEKGFLIFSRVRSTGENVIKILSHKWNKFRALDFLFITFALLLKHLLFSIYIDHEWKRIFSISIGFSISTHQIEYFDDVIASPLPNLSIGCGQICDLILNWKYTDVFVSLIVYSRTSFSAIWHLSPLPMTGMQI